MIECECFCTCCDTQVFLLPEETTADTILRCPSCGRQLHFQRLRPPEESEWLTCKNPAVFVQRKNPQATSRKRRLCACACCRRVWNRLRDSRSRQAVEVAERFADGLATPEELKQAHAEAAAVASATGKRYWEDVAFAAQGATSEHPRPITALNAILGRSRGRKPDKAAVVASLFRDILGNPFRSLPVLDAAVLAWNDRLVPRLAQAIYDERRFQDLPILADALADAGCPDTDLLEHCRGLGPHARGCWVLDLILGKS